MLSIGGIIRTNREERKISQEELSFGICSTSNLSRIENGEQIPSRATYEALMQRMGLSSEIYPSFQNDRELTAFELWYEINECMDLGQYSKAEILLEKLLDEPKLDKVYQQRILFAQTIILRKNGGGAEEALGSMKKVVSMSIKEFDYKKIPHYLLTKSELNILKSLATLYYQVDDETMGINILYGLKDYIEKRVVDHDGITPTYTAIIRDLSKWVGILGRHDEVVELCDIAIKRSIRYGRLYNLPMLLYNKGYALAMLGRSEEARNRLCEAYYIFRATNQSEMCDAIKGFLEEQGVNVE